MYAHNYIALLKEISSFPGNNNYYLKSSYTQKQAVFLCCVDRYAILDFWRNLYFN